MTDEDPERAPPLAKAGHFRALEIYLAVERHKQLHGFQLRVADGKHRGIRDELVREVFDRMAQFFQGVPGSCVDPPPAPGKRIGCRYVPRRSQGQCATDCASSHDGSPLLPFRHPAISEQITNVLFPVKTISYYRLEAPYIAPEQSLVESDNRVCNGGKYCLPSGLPRLKESSKAQSRKTTLKGQHTALDSQTGQTGQNWQ
jgi:hypothetical protein